MRRGVVAQDAAAGMALKTPSFLTTQRRVQWNPQERRVEQDALKHDALLASLRASFTWQAPGAFATQTSGTDSGGILPDVLAKISAAKRAAAQQREAELHEQVVDS
jgi:hypothetical protein